MAVLTAPSIPPTEKGIFMQIKNGVSRLSTYGKTGLLVLGASVMASPVFAAVDTTAIDSALTDIASLAGAAVTLAVGAFAAWAIYYKLKG